MSIEQVNGHKPKDGWSKWNLLWTALSSKFIKSFNHPELILYWFFIVIVLGANGVWLSIGLEQDKCRIDHKNIILSLCSYFIAVLASSSADLILAKPEYDPSSATNEEIRKKNQLRKMIAMLGISVLITGIALTVGSIYSQEGLGYTFSSIGVILTLIIWLIANAENPMTKDDAEGDPIAQIGGVPPVTPVLSTNDQSEERIEDDDLKEFKH